MQIRWAALTVDAIDYVRDINYSAQLLMCRIVVRKLLEALKVSEIPCCVSIQGLHPDSCSGLDF